MIQNYNQDNQARNIVMTTLMAGLGQYNGDMETFFFFEKIWPLERFHIKLMTSHIRRYIADSHGVKASFC